jgi:type IV pilus assembly protein PilN
MIRINLLKERRVKKAMPLQAIIIPGAIITVITLVILGVYTFTLTSNISTLKADKAQKQKRLDEIKDAIKQVESFERDNELYRQMNSTIERLKSRQVLPLRLLDEVSARLPQGVWLESLKEKGGTIDLKGIAFTNPNIVDYVQSLKNSKYITGVTLLESKMKSVEDYTLYEFKLSFRMKE